MCFVCAFLLVSTLLVLSLPASSFVPFLVSSHFLVFYLKTCWCNFLSLPLLVSVCLVSYFLHVLFASFCIMLMPTCLFSCFIMSRLGFSHLVFFLSYSDSTGLFFHFALSNLFFTWINSVCLFSLFSFHIFIVFPSVFSTRFHLALLVVYSSPLNMLMCFFTFFILSRLGLSHFVSSLVSFYLVFFSSHFD